jgi:hypothetical protein
MSELFDNVFEVALLTVCERFSRETGVPFSIRYGLPVFEYLGKEVEVILVTVKQSDHCAYRAPNSKLGNNTIIIRVYFGDVFNYKPFKKRMVDILDIPGNPDMFQFPFFSLPYNSYQELHDCKRVYLDGHFDKVEDLAHATYIFEMMNDTHVMFARRTVDPCRLAEQEVLLFETCYVKSRKGLGNDGR